jgi:hypothetical protein
MAFVGDPDLLRPPDPEIPVMISVAFTWDLKEGQRLADSWSRYYRHVQLGGPAYNDPGGDFVPGLFLGRDGVITSRGCPNKCWFCSVPKREGHRIRELPIMDGGNVFDDNLLACGAAHIRAVFAMLEKHKGPVQFTGGLEAKRLEQWHADELYKLRPRQLFFAYDEEADFEPLLYAGIRLRDAGFTLASHRLRCYVLCGYDWDDIPAAERRMRLSMEAGFIPMAMLYRDDKNTKRDPEWMKFQKRWARPALIHHAGK